MTLTHAQGTVTMSVAPARVVTLGYADTQIAHALGAPIVAAVRSPFPDGNWPGVDPPLSADVVRLPDGQPDLVRIAAAHPDLILAGSAADGFVRNYPALSRIAPVLSHLDPQFGADRVALVRAVGRLLGRSARAEQLISNAAARLRAFAAAHPELRGRTVVLGRKVGADVDVVPVPGPSAEFFAALGMTELPADRPGVDLRLLAGAGAASPDVIALRPAELALLADPNPAVSAAVFTVLQAATREEGAPDPGRNGYGRAGGPVP